MLILLSICMVGNPGTCREERINLAFQQVSPMQCLVEAQPMIAQWQQGHVQWHVERWRCTTAQKAGTDI